MTNDLAVSISQLTEGRSKEKETFIVVNKLRTQALLRGEFATDLKTTGNGVFATLWSATIPDRSTWTVQATITGRGTTGGASYVLVTSPQNYAGAVSIVGGGTWSVLYAAEDAAAMDAQLVLNGDVLELNVQDDGVQPMTWRAFVSCVGAV